MSACPHGDPLCPCQDGDPCHYEDTATTLAMPSPIGPMHRGPCGKARYDGEASARRAMRTMQRHGKGRRDRGRLHPYLCRACRGWHVGHTTFD